MDLLQRLFYTLLGAASLFYFVVKISLSHWKNRGILHEKPKFLWGNLKGVGRKRHISQAVAGIYEKYKGKAPFIGFYTFLKPMVLVLDLDLVQHVLSRNATEYFMERGLYHNSVDDPLSHNMLQLDGEQWEQLSLKLKKIFSEQQLPSLLPALLQVADTFKRSLAARYALGEEVYTINCLVDCYNTDVVSLLAFGHESDSLLYPQTEFRQMVRRYLGNFQPLKAYWTFHFPLLARILQYKSYDEEATRYFVKLVDDKIKEREWNHPQQQDFLQLLVDLKQRESITNTVIAAQSFSFILAGLEPCNATLTFCLYELALQPELQQCVHEEIVHILERHQGQLKLESLREMQLLKKTLYETLRKHSPYPLLLRNTVKDYEVPNSVFMLKQSNHAIIPIAAIHHDPDLYPEPAKFDPERFAPATAAQRHPMSWLPYGIGPRSCIALHFGELQMLVGLVTLLGEYEFSPCSDTHIPLQYNSTKLVLAPKTDVRLRVKRRGP